jgi:hypothetical protein
MRVWHPDRFQGDAALKEKAEKKTREINEAYQRALHYQEGPGADAGAALQKMHARMEAGKKSRRLFFDLFILAAIVAVLFGALYLYFIFKENSGKLRVGGVTFKEYEWDRFFKPGSTRDEVLAIQGPPERAEGERWVYGGDSVTFSKGRVSRYSNVSGKLHVRVLPEHPPALPPSGFSIGSTKDDVLAVQGSPTRLEGNVWYYGPDSVLFAAGRVAGFVNVKGSLRLKLVAKNERES